MTDAKTSEERVEWIDCCKGICILLVVFGHIIGGLDASGVLKGDFVFGRLRDWVYLFHIPAFFFLSGLFARRASQRPFVQFLRGRVRVLFYPYLVWTAIFLASQYAMGPFVNTPPSLSRALRCLWEPYGVGLWFLYTLFLISILFSCLLRFRLPSIAIVSIGVVGYVLAQYRVFGFWYVLNACWAHAIFFMLGGCFPGVLVAPNGRARRPPLGAAGVGLFALMTLAMVVPSDWAGIIKLVAAVVGIVAVVCVAMALTGTRFAAPWVFLGTYSLEIYLAHPLWGTASRALLMRSGVHSTVLFVVCGVALGVVGSAATALACRRLHFPYLFRWPAHA